MAHLSVEALMEESVARLDVISERRNVLLREMHQMIQRRNDLGSVLTFEDEDGGDLQIFLQRFAITRDDPKAGSITNLDENEFLASTSRENIDVSMPPTSSEKPSPSGITRGRQILDGALSPKLQRYRHGLLLPRQGFSSTSAADAPGEVLTEFMQSRVTSVPLPPQQGSDGEDELDLLRKSPPARALPYAPVDLEHSDTHLVGKPATGTTDTSGQVVPSTPTELDPVTQGQVAAVAVSLEKGSDEKNVVEAAVPSESQATEASGMDVDNPPVSTVNPQELVVEGPAQVSQDMIMPKELHNSHADNFEQPESEALSVIPNGVQALPKISHGRHTFLPVTSSPAKRPLIVLSTHSSRVPERDYVFSELPPQPSQPTPASATPLQRRLQFSQTFTVPPLKAINPEYVRKSKSLKRKRDKERDLGGNRKESGKDDSAPLGLNKWAATLNANPVWKKVSRAHKCLSTREWAIAMSELRLVRAIDRIESLKREGRWSFRQPKKQRAIGGIPKTHWDHLMDEMKWMRIDFREERKWKIALAYNLSTAVLDWHAAGTMQVRVAKGICVRWKRLRHEGQDQEMTIDENIDFEPSADQGEMEVDESEDSHPQQTSLLGVNYGSDDENEDEDEDEDGPAENARNAVDPLEPGILVEDALSDAHRLSDTQSDGPQTIQPKAEEVEDGSALMNHGVGTTGNGITAMVIDDTKPHTASALKTTSIDPILTSQGTPSSTSGDTDHLSSVSLKSSMKLNIYAPFREIIAYSEDDKLFLDLEEFDIVKRGIPRTIVPDDTLLPSPDLTAVFPDLQVFGLLDPSPVVQAGPDGKKRLDKRIDRDDPTKRPDDILYTRLYPTGNLMMTKPTLIGPLRPSKNWSNGQWLPLDETPVAPEADAPMKVSDDNLSDLFDGRSSSAPSVMMAMHLQAACLKDKDGRKRTADHLWSNADDALLKSLIDKYSNNWALISECFNSSRLTISTDKRTPRDCLDRWRDKWAPEIRRPADNPPTAEATPPPASGQMTTRGVKRFASASVSSTAAVGMVTGGEPRKKRRHLLVQETIRKAGKKRAEALQRIQAAQRKPPAIHETHAQYSKLPKRTPAELSRMKAEKESRDLQELHQARKKQEELNRHNLMTRMMNGVPDQQQAMPQQQQQVATTMQRPVGTGIPAPSQVVPQIRSQVNISQQQRANTPSIQGTGRLTQQLLQAQARAAHQQQQQQVQVHAQALVQAQNQIQNNAVNVNGSAPANTPHVSPPFAARDVTSSPAHMSPPHNSTVPSTVNSPRPPSAQSHILQMPGNAGTRGGYYLPNVTNVVQGYTAEQIHTALRLQHQQHQHQQAQQPLAGFPTQP